MIKINNKSNCDKIHINMNKKGYYYYYLASICHVTWVQGAHNEWESDETVFI